MKIILLLFTLILIFIIFDNCNMEKFAKKNKKKIEPKVEPTKEKVIVPEIDFVPMKAARNCRGEDCKIENQICPKSAQGSLNKNWICKNKKWKEYDIKPADSCLGDNCQIERQICNAGVSGSAGKNWLCVDSKWNDFNTFN